jgi:hypothetical protein
VSDALSPESAAAANIVLKRLLWLRMSADRKQRVTDRPWSRLEQALKATDLLLQAGGFAAIVLDMSDVLPHCPFDLQGFDVALDRVENLAEEFGGHAGAWQ